MLVIFEFYFKLNFLLIILYDLKLHEIQIKECFLLENYLNIL